MWQYNQVKYGHPISCFWGCGQCKSSVSSIQHNPLYFYRRFTATTRNLMIEHPITTKFIQFEANIILKASIPSKSDAINIVDSHVFNCK
jgi:hypothetical protein